MILKLPDTSASATAPTNGRGVGVVKVQKREAKAPNPMREKVCATCGRAFALLPEQKFYNCPHCYRKSQPPRKAARKTGAQVLIQITCVACKTVEYLDFVPTDPSATLCRACFAKRWQGASSPSTKP